MIEVEKGRIEQQVDDDKLSENFSPSLFKSIFGSRNSDKPHHFTTSTCPQFVLSILQDGSTLHCVRADKQSFRPDWMHGEAYWVSRDHDQDHDGDNTIAKGDQQVPCGC